MQGNHYEVLGVGIEASVEEIRAAYHAALRGFRQKLLDGKDPGPELLDILRHAYKTLIDPDARRQYDDTLAPASPPAAVAIGGTAASGAVAADAGPERHDFSFSGRGGEYFRIWIVNLLLSVLTLGIYSAWAKVRREQYFHRNLRLDGSGFDYHGRPLAILKGRALAFGLLIALTIAQKLSPLAYGLAVLALLPAIPWLVVRALRFRAHNTSYCGLRFSFHGTTRQALTVFVGYGLLTVLTFGLCFPLWYRAQRKFVLDHLRFGTTNFACALAVWPVYRMFIVPAVAVVAVVLFLAASMAGAAALPKAQAQAAIIGLGALIFGFVLVTQMLLAPYLYVRSTNLVWNATTFGPHRAVSELRLGGYFRVVLGNWLLLVLTLGLFWPWAKVRLAAYRAGHSAVLAAAPLDAFVAGEATKAAAVGDEVAEMFDVDFGV